MTNVQLEMNCIKKLMTDQNPELLVRLDTTMFGNEELKKLFLLIKSSFVNNSAFIGWDVLRSTIAQKSSSTSKAQQVISLLDMIQERDIKGLSDDTLIDEMNQVGKCRQVLHCIDEVTKAAENRDYDAVMALYRQGYNSVFLNNSYQLDDCDMSNMAGSKVEFNFLTTGIKPIDERGGLIEGGFIIVAAESGAGKSTLTKQWAEHAYLECGESVAIYSYEQNKAEIRARILSSQSGVDLGNIMSEELSEEDKLKIRVAESRFVCKPEESLEDFCKENNGLDDISFFSKLYEGFAKRENKFLILDDPVDWDNLFVKMELLRTTKDIGFHIVDYPYIVPRGAADRQLASWEYALVQSRNLKQFAKRHSANGRPTRVIVPAQYDSKEDTLRYVKGLINDADMFIKMWQEKEDKELGQVNVGWNKYRNFKTVPGKPFLDAFRLQMEFHISKFRYVDF